MSDNLFQRIIAGLDAADSDSGVVEKTAAEKESQVRDPQARMLQTVRAVTESLQQPSQKTASHGNVTADLHRMAKEAQEAEGEALLKQAHFLGSAVCDGFMERFAQYDGALAQVTPKTASALEGQTGYDDNDLRKVAEAAYMKAQEDFQKQAEAEAREEGYRDTLQQFHKIASDIHYIGQQAAHTLLAAAQQQSAQDGAQAAE